MFVVGKAKCDCCETKLGEVWCFPRASPWLYSHNPEDRTAEVFLRWYGGRPGFWEDPYSDKTQSLASSLVYKTGYSDSRWRHDFQRQSQDTFPMVHPRRCFQLLSQLYQRPIELVEIRGGKKHRTTGWRLAGVHSLTLVTSRSWQIMARLEPSRCMASRHC